MPSTRPARHDCDHAALRPTPAHRAAYACAADSVLRGEDILHNVFATARLGKDVPLAEAFALVGEIDAMFESGNHLLLDVVRMKAEDEYTYIHSIAVCALMIRFARFLGMAEDTVRECGLAGLLHDVGKMRLAPDVLHKHGPFTHDEYAEIKSHSEQGYQILKGVAGIPPGAVEFARLHHEKIDGSGYPLGLSGDQIPLLARMGAICDVYDALTSERAYKVAWSPAAAIAKMRTSPGHFDPDLLEAFAASLHAETTGA